MQELDESDLKAFKRLLVSTNSSFYFNVLNSSLRDSIKVRPGLLAKAPLVNYPFS